MNWGFACCCSPTQGGDAEKVSLKPASSEEGPSSLGHGHGPADKVLPAASAAAEDERRPRDTAAAPRTGAVPPAVAAVAGARPAATAAAAPSLAQPQVGPSGQEQDLETCSVASSRVSGRSFGTAASSIASEFINEHIPARQQETNKIQQSMKTFVRGMVRGQQMGVVSPDGALRTCQCSLDKKLKTFSIELKGSVRKIALSEMSDVFQGKEPEDIDTPLDDLCATVMLQSQECISFHFPDIPAREHFAMCLQMLVDGQQ